MATFNETLQSAIGLGGSYARRPRLFSNVITSGVFGVWAGSSLMRLSLVSPPTRASQAELSRYNVDLSGLDTFGAIDFLSPLDFPQDAPNVGQTFLVDGAMNQYGTLCVVMGQQDEETGAAAGYDVGVVAYDPVRGLWQNASVLGYLGTASRDGTEATEEDFRETEHGGLKLVTMRDGRFVILAATHNALVQWVGDKTGTKWSAAQVIKVGVANQFKHTKIDARVDAGNRIVMFYDEYETLTLGSRAIRRITMKASAKPEIDEEETVVVSTGGYYPRWPSFSIKPTDIESMDLVYAWLDDAQNHARVTRRRNGEWQTPADLFLSTQHTLRPDPAIIIDDRNMRHIVYCRRSSFSIQNVFYRSMTDEGVLGTETTVNATTFNSTIQYGADPGRHPAVEFPSLAYLPRYSKLICAWDAQTAPSGDPHHAIRFAYSDNAVTGARIEAPEFVADCFAVHCPSNAGHSAQIDVQDSTVTVGDSARSELWWEE